MGRKKSELKVNSKIIPCAPPGRESDRKPIGSRIKAKITINVPNRRDCENDEKKVSSMLSVSSRLKIPIVMQNMGTREMTKNDSRAHSGESIQSSKRKILAINELRNASNAVLPFFGKNLTPARAASDERQYTHISATVAIIAWASRSEAIIKSAAPERQARGEEKQQKI
jgi:hypothetical protein